MKTNPDSIGEQGAPKQEGKKAKEKSLVNCRPRKTLFAIAWATYVRHVALAGQQTWHDTAKEHACVEEIQKNVAREVRRRDAIKRKGKK